MAVRTGRGISQVRPPTDFVLLVEGSWKSKAVINAEIIRRDDAMTRIAVIATHSRQLCTHRIRRPFQSLRNRPPLPIDTRKPSACGERLSSPRRVIFRRFSILACFYYLTTASSPMRFHFLNRRQRSHHTTSIRITCAGACYQALERREDALRAWRTALKLNPKNARLLQVLVVEYGKGRYFQDAAEVARRALELAPDDRQCVLPRDQVVSGCRTLPGSARNCRSRREAAFRSLHGRISSMDSICRKSGERRRR